MCATDVCLSSATVGTAPQTFASAVSFLAASQCLITENWPQEAHVHNFSKFDFIIVGAGTAGSVLANRLTEIPSVNVLLIEAGIDPPVESIIPAMDQAMFTTQYDWKYTTDNSWCANQTDAKETCSWPRGRMLGGCSSINAMIYIRGSRQDYQSWYDEGNVEWHPDIVDKYFKKAENLQDMRIKQSPYGERYGDNGPLVINTFNHTERQLTEIILQSWNEIGIPTVMDLNGPEVTRAGVTRCTAFNGKRESTATAYIIPVQERSNLRIIKNALVTKILIKSGHNYAYGVAVKHNNEMKYLFANKEVVISAGTINTPQLLLLSGIGPKEHLRNLRIKSLADLPVGENLQDHITVPITIFGDYGRVYDPSNDDIEAIKYLLKHQGALAQLSLFDVISFYAKSLDSNYPDFQNHVVTFEKNSPHIYDYLTKNAKFYKEMADSVSAFSKNHSTFMFMFNLLHPVSRGKIKLQSKDPLVHPYIYADYLKDPKDLEATAYGIKMITKIVNTSFFKSIGGFLGRIKWGPCNDFELDSKEYWTCITSNIVSTIFHPVGTAKMGKNPTNSVVDSRLRVHGVNKLRVVDASVMPTITSGNTNGPVVMIAERASDLIKEDHDLI